MYQIASKLLPTTAKLSRDTSKTHPPAPIIAASLLLPEGTFRPRRRCHFLFLFLFSWKMSFPLIRENLILCKFSCKEHKSESKNTWRMREVKRRPLFRFIIYWACSELHLWWSESLLFNYELYPRLSDKIHLQIGTRAKCITASADSAQL